MAKGNGNTRGLFSSRTSEVRAYPGEVLYATEREMEALLRSATSRGEASRKIAEAVKEFKDKGQITATPINVGQADRSIRSHAESIGKPLQSDEMYFTGGAISHVMRGTKREAGIGVEERDIISFPGTKDRMEIYYDKNTGNYTYTDRKNKFVVQPNKRIKLGSGREKVVSLVTASKMREDGYTEFRMGKYTKIK